LETRSLNNKKTANTFTRTFYIANTLEIFERIAWYGFFTVSSLYMSTTPSAGGLGFSDTERGILQGIIPFFVYVLPVVTGAMGDRVGYRKMFLIAFALLTPSYLLLGQVREFWPFFCVYMVVALGAAIFKPLVVGTVVRSANDDNRGRAFGIFYMMVNVGGFLGPVIAGFVRAISWDHVFWLSSIAIGINLLIALFFLEDDSPKRGQTVVDPEKDQSNADPLSQTVGLQQRVKATHETSSDDENDAAQSAASGALADAIEVLGNGRFALLLIPIILGLMIAGGGWITWHDYGLFLLFWFGTQVIWDRLVQDATSEAPWYGQKLRVGNAPFLVYLLVLSLFWAVYNQIFLTFPLYIQDFVNTSDAVAIAQSFSDTFAQFIAPVDTARLAEALKTLSAIQPESVEAGRTLVQYQIRVPVTELGSGLAALSSGGISADSLANEWASEYRQVSPEYIIAFDFLSIVLFQYFISRWGENRAPFGMLILGTGMIGAAFVIGGMSHMVAFGGVLTIASIIVFAFGEMFASPKSQEYVASTSSLEQAALFQGYYFVSIAIGYLLAGIMSGWAYGEIAVKANQPFVMWGLFAGLAVIAMFALALFNRYLAPHMGAGTNLIEAHYD
jgi:dipeptide/tripeptide permease